MAINRYILQQVDHHWRNKRVKAIHRKCNRYAVDPDFRRRFAQRMETSFADATASTPDSSVSKTFKIQFSQRTRCSSRHIFSPEVTAENARRHESTIGIDLILYANNYFRLQFILSIEICLQPSYTMVGKIGKFALLTKDKY